VKVIFDIGRKRGDYIQGGGVRGLVFQWFKVPSINENFQLPDQKKGVHDRWKEHNKVEYLYKATEGFKKKACAE